MEKRTSLCPYCSKEFKDKYEKYKHLHKFGETDCPQKYSQEKKMSSTRSGVSFGGGGGGGAVSADVQPEKRSRSKSPEPRTSERGLKIDINREVAHLISFVETGGELTPQIISRQLFDSRDRSRLKEINIIVEERIKVIEGTPFKLLGACNKDIEEAQERPITEGFAPPAISAGTKDSLVKYANWAKENDTTLEEIVLKRKLAIINWSKAHKEIKDEKSVLMAVSRYLIRRREIVKIEEEEEKQRTIEEKVGVAGAFLGKGESQPYDGAIYSSDEEGN